VNRSDFQNLADERVDDAQALLNAGRWSAAYYMAGYAVECGLKACIARLTQQYDFPTKERGDNCLTHDLARLVRLARLDSDLDNALNQSSGFVSSWNTVKDWNESARYRVWTEFEARTLYNALTDRNAGVLPWIKAHW
jgi:hypothetical protein